MPIYEYECRSCGERIEAIQRFSDAPLTTCSSCGGELTKLISNTSFVLKGGGWYADGYAAPTPQKSDKAAKGAKGEGGKKSPARGTGSKEKASSKA